MTSSSEQPITANGNVFISVPKYHSYKRNIFFANPKLSSEPPDATRGQHVTLA